MNKNNCYQCYNSRPIEQICNITKKDIKDDDILNNDCKNFKAMCSECEIEYPIYEYKDNLYCSECLLEKLESEEKIEVWTVKHYMLNDDYIGNNDENDMEEVTEDITKRLHIKKIEKED